MSKQFMRRKNRKLRYDDNDEALGLLDGSDSDDTANEAINLPVKRKPQICFIEHLVQEGDTLSSLCLQFNCTISQIKQFNNIHRDNEIFALRVVRIPITPFSVVTEKISGAPGPSSDVGDLINIGDDKKHEFVNPSQGIPVDTFIQQHSDAASLSDISVCNPLLTPLPAPVIPSSLIDPALDIASSEVQSPDNNTSLFFNCNGADCGIPWLMLLVCTLAVGFVGPLIYIFLLYEEKKHHTEGALSS